MSMLKREEEIEVEVTIDDQNDINTFNRKNARLGELKDDLDMLQTKLEGIEEVEGEIMMSDEEMFKYKIGESFVEVTMEKAEELLEAEKEVAEGEVEGLETEIEQLTKDLASLKNKLYLKFKHTINLDESG